jgi:dTDP-4-dehydrorhamnose reductase
MLILGSTGQLGTAFCRLRLDARAVDRAALDLTRLDRISAVLDELRPDALVNCAAYTRVDAAEDDEEAARAVNALAVGEMAAWAKRRSVPFLTFSTDYVFDGSLRRPYLEGDLPNPLGAYGRTKLEGERRALEAHPGALIVRTSWVISGTHPNFVATILRRSQEQTLRVVDDQHGCPTVVDDLARVSLQALERGVSGILHLTNAGPTTWYELARTAVTLGGGDPERIQPCTTADYPTRASRPAFSVLGSDRLTSSGVDPLPPWRESLPAVVAALTRSP